MAGSADPELARRLSLLRAATARLAQPAAEQELYIRELFSGPAVVDELALELEDYYQPVPHLLDGARYRPLVERLRALDELLTEMSGPTGLWDFAALRSPQWAAVRVRAQAVLDEYDRLEG